MANSQPLFTAVSSSARQLILLLRCISFAKKVQVRISLDGLHFTTDQGSVMEAFVVLEKALFTSYTYNHPAPPSSQDDPLPQPVFEVSLSSLLETLSIFSLYDPATIKRPSGDPSFDAFGAHRLHRHAGFDPFSARSLGMTGTCTFTYDGDGSPLRIHMAESGVTTSCDLTTYEAASTDPIPFRRDALALKTIMRSTYLLDAIVELASLTPTELTINAFPQSRRQHGTSALSISASGALGSVSVSFSAPSSPSNGAATTADPPILETFQCHNSTRARFSFSALQAAQRAMGAATKVSLRIDEAGVLSLQFLVEIEPVSNAGGALSIGNEKVAFVDFRVVSLVDDEYAEEEDSGGSSTADD
ncbi:Hypothetical protein R9X50_00615900 [Acrodontium crateriforme]|uniref:Uncharacterized protein n=1 Tax=Acrodontium crateriforme TaxID=150365 RepID=A0AAQ3M7G1_9PEZI|nr:Hypothetical protein R9X50_00615900 [Acrodontium crateriforme]